MQALENFIDETFPFMTGIGEMKVAEAIFMGAVDNASKVLASSTKDNSSLMREVISHAYKGQNIIKLCSHLPHWSNVEKQARDLYEIAHKIDSLICSVDVE